MSEQVPNLDSEGRLLDRNCAEEWVQKLNSVSAGRFGKIIEAGKLYGYTPQIILDIMKLTIYPRSDYEYLPENQFEDAPEILEHLKTLPHKEFVELVRNADTKIKTKA